MSTVHFVHTHRHEHLRHTNKQKPTYDTHHTPGLLPEPATTADALISTYSISSMRRVMTKPFTRAPTSLADVPAQVCVYVCCMRAKVSAQSTIQNNVDHDQSLLNYKHTRSISGQWESQCTCRARQWVCRQPSIRMHIQPIVLRIQ